MAAQKTGHHAMIGRVVPLQIGAAELASSKGMHDLGITSEEEPKPAQSGDNGC